MTQLSNHIEMSEDLPVRSDEEYIAFARVLLKLYDIEGEIEDFSNRVLKLNELYKKKFDPFMLSYGSFMVRLDGTTSWSHLDTYPTAENLLSAVHQLIKNKQKMV